MMDVHVSDKGQENNKSLIRFKVFLPLWRII